MKTPASILLGFILVSVVGACTKPGTGGKAKIAGHVKHHEVHIPSAEVYIKYDATEFPGINLSVYDNQTTAGSTDGYYEFVEMNKGDYYLYARGYDGSISEVVTGGTPVEIKGKKEEVKIDVQVAE